MEPGSYAGISECSGPARPETLFRIPLFSQGLRVLGLAQRLRRACYSVRRACYSVRRACYSVRRPITVCAGPLQRAQSLRRAYHSVRRACYSVRRPIIACAGLLQRAQSLRRACAGPVHGAHITPARDLAESRENSDQKLGRLMGRF